MLGYMNAGSLLESFQSGKVTFYSRSKDRLWTKGESSGNFLYLKEVYKDCDADTLLVFATPSGPVCHTGSRTCFDLPAYTSFVLSSLEQIISVREENLRAGSYTSLIQA